MRITLLNPNTPNQMFPPVRNALDDPNGLLAMGGCLSPKRLINAYQNGIFPWYNPGEPILWWSPNPRLVLAPERLHISRSLAKSLRNNCFNLTLDQSFIKVMQACAKPRTYADGTWINREMELAYLELHHLGIAHSIEIWEADALVGGLYGLAFGQVFFGESMFHTRTDASKIAFVTLVNYLKSWNYRLIDCQVYTSHLASLGAEEIDRSDFIAQLNQLCPCPPHEKAWQI